MNINDHTLNTITTTYIDFGAITEPEYDVLCATSFSFHGKSWARNFKYEELTNEDGQRTYKRERIGSVFEFPSEQWVNAWLQTLPPYFTKPPVKKGRKPKQVLVE